VKEREFMKRIVLLLFLLFILSSCSSQTDLYSKEYNFSYITSIYDIELNYGFSNSNFIQGDIALIEARINGESVLESVPYYKEAIKDTSDLQEKAILYETIGSITGEKRYYKESYLIWFELNNTFRSQIDWHLWKGKIPPYDFEEYIIKDKLLATPKGATSFSIGENYFFIEEEDILVSQVDRVTRDWLSSQIQETDSKDILTIFSEEYDVEGIGWHEGGRIKQYKEIVDFEHIPVTGTLVRRVNGRWFAPNEDGVFMFEVPIDKVQYPTTRYLSKDLALIIDTHGVNMLVEQAIQNEASIVMGCCDHPGKVHAAMYLNEKGVKVICNTDKHLPLALGESDLTLGSVPFYDANNKVQLGYQPILINLSEKIIVLNSTNFYGLTYYSTPTYYFTELKRKTLLPLDLEFVYIDDFDQMDKVIQKAKDTNSKIIAARVYNEGDYINLKNWLKESKEHRLVLFHSEPYPYGYKIYREFKEQVTFDDINPVFY
jgi:hypothetical protein